MARKKKETSPEEEIDGAKLESIEETQEVPVDDGKIHDEQQAIDFVRANFNVPEHVQTVYVAGDKNVFYRANTAKVHCDQNKLKMFAIKWQA